MDVLVTTPLPPVMLITPSPVMAFPAVKVMLPPLVVTGPLIVSVSPVAPAPVAPAVRLMSPPAVTPEPSIVSGLCVAMDTLPSRADTPLVTSPPVLSSLMFPPSELLALTVETVISIALSEPIPVVADRLAVAAVMLSIAWPLKSLASTIALPDDLTETVPPGLLIKPRPTLPADSTVKLPPPAFEPEMVLLPVPK